MCTFSSSSIPPLVVERWRAGVLSCCEKGADKVGLLDEGRRERGVRARCDVLAGKLARVCVLVEEEGLRLRRWVGRVPGWSIGSPRSRLKAELGSKRSGCSQSGEGEAGGCSSRSSSSESMSISTASNLRCESEEPKRVRGRGHSCAASPSSREPARSMGCDEGPATAWSSMPVVADAELTSEPEPLLMPRWCQRE